jgi:two-component system alkaline phosphatase synthesis response regulator PhoP
MLTARSEETDKIVGLSVGADDYLTKPFSPRELVARVKAALRRLRDGVGPTEATTLTFRHLRIDTGSRQVWVDDELVELTPTEFDLLRILADHRGLVLSREQLLQQVWGYDFYGEERVVDVHIGHIRQKLGDGRFIVTVRGVGYRFEEEEA